MSTINISKVSITKLDTDAIVNAANKGLQAGGGVCGAIFSAAGYDQLQKACNIIGHCKTGSAVITPGFNLKAKYIIHAVGPRWKDGKHKEPELLYSAYYKSLELAIAHDCKSIGFPLISSGIFGYPVQKAWYQACDACKDFLDKHEDISLDIIFAVLNDDILKTGRKVLNWTGASRYKIADRNDWEIKEMPKQHDTFIYKRPISETQMAALRRGHIPREMEDKWFFFMEGDTLYAHRSWTGNCIFRVDFKPDNNHVVTVNRDPGQYKSTSIVEDAKTLNDLLNNWNRDFIENRYVWSDEMVVSLEEAGKIQD